MAAFTDFDRASACIIVVGRVRTLRSPLFDRTGDERTLPFSLTNGQSPALGTSVNAHQMWGTSRYLTLRSYSSYPASPFSSIRSSRGILQTSRPSSTTQGRRPHQEPSSSALPGKNKNMLAYMGCLTYRYGPVLTTLCPFSSCSFTTRARYAFSRKVKNMM